MGLLLLIKVLKCFQVGTDEDGKILSMKGNIYENAGSHWNEQAFSFTEAHLKNCYDSSTWNVSILDVQTDLPTNIYCRSPGTFHAMQACGGIFCFVERASQYIHLKENHLDTQFILQYILSHTSTCFGRVCSLSSGGRLQLQCDGTR